MTQAFHEGAASQPYASDLDLIWPTLLFGLVVVGALSLSVALLAGGALDRLLPNGELFLPYFTT